MTTMDPGGRDAVCLGDGTRFAIASVYHRVEATIETLILLD